MFKSILATAALLISMSAFAGQGDSDNSVLEVIRNPVYGKTTLPTYEEQRLADLCDKSPEAMACNPQRVGTPTPAAPEKRVGCWTVYPTQSGAQANCPANAVVQQVWNTFGETGWTCNCTRPDNGRH